jgi:peptidyl-tRNA hydrolase, PTH1 family
MKMVIGLGNPGAQYKNNRHNAGHMLADFLQSKHVCDMKLMKTDCYMNTSGKFVKKIVAGNNVDLANLYVAHDDLDIPLGKFKIQLATGPKVHNGLESIENELGTADFWRIRIGVDNRTADRRVNGEQYVLEDFTDEEMKQLTEVFSQILAHPLLK